MTKIVVNRCYGGFSISEKAIYRIAELKGITLYPEYDARFGARFVTYWTVPSPPKEYLEGNEWDKATIEQRKESKKLHEELTLDTRMDDRSDPHLVQAVEELGKEANGDFAELKVVEIPDDVEWQIEEYDGHEWVAEKHRTW